MPRVWQTNAGDSKAGPCAACRALDGQLEGDGWTMNPFDGQPGPPPLHPHCACTVVDVAADQAREAHARYLEQWAATLQASTLRRAR